MRSRPATPRLGDTTCVQHWLRQAAALPLLTPAEELHLGRLIQRGAHPQANDRDRRAALRARQRMISANLRLVVSIAKTLAHRLKGTCMQFEDLLQEGSFGLHRAAEKFDPQAGCRFSTYAYLWVWQGMAYALEANSGSVRLPHRVIQKLRRQAEGSPTANTDRQGWRERQRLEAARQMLMPLSLDDPLLGHDGLMVIDGLADGQSTNPLDRLDLERAMHCIRVSGVDVRPLYRVVVEGESISALSRQRGISKQALSKRLQRDRSRLALVVSDHSNLIGAVG